MLFLFTCVLLFRLTLSQIRKEVTFNASSPSSQNDASVAINNISTTINGSQWDIKILSQSEYDVLLTLDTSWGFKSNINSSVIVTLDGITNSISKNDADLIIVFAVDDLQYFGFWCHLDKIGSRSKIYPMNNIGIENSVTEYLSFSSDQPFRYDRIVGGNGDNWFFSVPRFNAQSIWPLQYKIINDPINNQIIFQYYHENSIYVTGNIFQLSSFNTNKEIKVFIMGDSLEEEFSIKSINVKLIHESLVNITTSIPVTSIPTTSSPSTQPSVQPSSNPITFNPVTALPTTQNPTLIPTNQPSVLPTTTGNPTTVSPTTNKPTSNEPTANPITLVPITLPPTLLSSSSMTETTKISNFPSSAPTTPMPTPKPTLTPILNTNFGINSSLFEERRELNSSKYTIKQTQTNYIDIETNNKSIVEGISNSSFYIILVFGSMCLVGTTILFIVAKRNNEYNNKRQIHNVPNINKNKDKSFESVMMSNSQRGFTIYKLKGAISPKLSRTPRKSPRTYLKVESNTLSPNGLWSGSDIPSSLNTGNYDEFVGTPEPEPDEDLDYLDDDLDDDLKDELDDNDDNDDDNTIIMDDILNQINTIQTKGGFINNDNIDISEEGSDSEEDTTSSDNGGNIYMTNYNDYKEEEEEEEGTMTITEDDDTYHNRMNTNIFSIKMPSSKTLLTNINDTSVINVVNNQHPLLLLDKLSTKVHPPDGEYDQYYDD